MKGFIICFIVIGVLNFSCDTNPQPMMDDDMPPIQECPNFESDELNIVWYYPLQPDTSLSRSMYPVLHENGVFFSDRFSEDNLESVNYIDKLTGEQNWKWEDSQSTSLVIVPNSSPVISNSNIYFSSEKKLYAIDLNSGNELWTLDITGSSPRIKAIGEFVYFGNNLYSGQAIVRAGLTRVGTNSNKIELYSKDVTNNYEPRFEMPSLYMNFSSDSILIFQNRSFNFNTSVGKIDLIAFNLKSMSLEWEVENLTPDGNSSVFPPIIYESKVYFQGANSIHCLDAETGNQIWSEQIIGESFFQGPPLIAEDKLILNGDTRSIYAFNIYTGTLVWQNDDTGSTVPNMAYYDGHVFFGSLGTAKLYKLRASDGFKVYELNPPNRICNSSTQFSGGVTIDQSTGLLYTDDQFFAMCIDLNE